MKTGFRLLQFKEDFDIIVQLEGRKVFLKVSNEKGRTKQPKLANDTHELRLAHETRNMILNAEMKLRASLFRTESRGAHYREDYPARNDKEWLAWVIISLDGDKMKLYKKPLPESWKPDPSVPYERRYRMRFPGELEYLRKNA